MKHPKRSIHVIMNSARVTLGMTQRSFGEAVGASHRTAARWDAGSSTPGEHHLHTLARLLLPLDRSLAVEVADAAGETLEGLGLEVPPAPPPPPQPASPPSPVVRAEDLVDVLVLTAVEQSGSTPSAVRPWLHAVMKRGAELRLTMEDAERALRPAPSAGSASKGRKS